MTFHRIWWSVATGVLLTTTLCSAVVAQEGPPGPTGVHEELRVAVGVPVPDVESATDPDERYAVFLPTSYDAGGNPPVLILMDPRGRAMVPLDLFRRGAETFGYVVLSSYNTLSDDATAFEQNDRALNAMIVDAQARFRIDPARIYLVGFSGTAHYAWTVSAQLDGSLAGLVGVGGGLPAYTKPIQMGMAMKRPFAYYGVAGIGDFNYDGVRWLEEALDTTRVQHRFVTHEGRHEWPSEQISYDAVEWFELQAMRTGQRPEDKRWLRDLRDKYMSEARKLEKSGDRASALRRYREIAADFEMFEMADAAEDRFEVLASDPDVAEELRRRDELSRTVQLYKLDVRKFNTDYRRANPPMSHDEALERLKIPELLKQAGDRDEQTAGAARRMLASAYANTSFYEARDYLRERNFVKAAGVLRIAQAIYPGVPRTCYQLAEATAQIGETAEATEALSCAVEGGWSKPEEIEADTLLAPIRATSAYRAILATAGSSQ